MPRSIPTRIAPQVLQWARISAGVLPEEAAKCASTSEDAYLAWEADNVDIAPSLAQARKLANLFKRPLALMMASEPPPEIERTADFRRQPGLIGGDSRNLKIQIRKAVARRELFLDVAREIGAPAETFEERATIIEDPEDVAARLRAFLDVSIDEQTQWPQGRQAFNQWRAAIEQKGILTFQVERVPAELMHGFSLSERPLPVVVVNRKDTFNRRIFTLFHEMTHVLLGGSVLCDLSEEGIPADQERIEVFCNRVAAAALVPQANLKSSSIVLAHRQGEEWTDDEIETLSAHFGVSDDVIVRRLLTFNLVTPMFYRRKHAEYARRRPAGKGGPVPPDVNALSLFGDNYVKMVLEGSYQGVVSPSDVSQALNLKLDHLAKIEARVFQH